MPTHQAQSHTLLHCGAKISFLGAWCLKLLNGERIKSLGHAMALFEVAVISIISLQRDTYWAEHQQLPLWICRYNVSESSAKLNLLPHVNKYHAVVYYNISSHL